MKKIKKLLFNPLRFIADSWFCKYAHLEDFKKTKNLFVLTHLGQLAQAEALIKQEKLLNCVLIILYTKKNTKMPELVRKSSDPKLFNRVQQLKIPSFPNKIHIKNLVYINNSYRELLAKIKPNRLFIFSFEKHYSLLAQRAIDRKIEVNLIEEGTATYKYNSLKEANFLINSSLSAKERKTAFFIRTLPIFKELRPALSLFHNFKKVYAVFPELLKNTFSFKEGKEFFLYSDIEANKNILDIIRRYEISSNDIIFLNQRYPFPQTVYAKCLIHELSIYANRYHCKVFLKLHPKDPTELKDVLRNEIDCMSMNSNIILIDEYGFLIESLIKETSPKKVVALTSTSLVYSGLLSKNTNSESIYLLIKEKMLEHINYDHKVFYEVEDHFNILKKFEKNISFINNSSEI
ncbi:alpha-2,8-polysialyltransferase family protein [Actinobacillus equuli subsp. haemolyticus]|uniref:alpha-2,8-polysialyltransferase family protein n=1 Tax=Actinobacillus equuli TaxID=718 RepID=UPI0024426DD9|nr:alpha-2,8-polysialyltransferase family protein [Actinobacillus equuli]WGE63021.1 alpha-2,8-polysialyltransferase family protein [Actinobacillus equuli subsp. haemolyticus]